MDEQRPASIEGIRRAVVDGGRLRIRAAVMTTATTIIALLPVLTSTGRGSDIMIPMAIPTFGGMVVATVTWFIVPILYCWTHEWRLRLSPRPAALPRSTDHASVEGASP
jgi:Cu(I)/Ag(I) efflux system membrane protein CusA/SilA